MPIHDWSRVDAGVFHAFHHDWITEIARALNRGILPDDYYAMPEQHTPPLFAPDVLTLQARRRESDDAGETAQQGTLLLAPTKLQPVAESDLAFYRRKQKHVTVRHVSDDEIIAIVELVSPGNKSGRAPMWAFVEKAASLIEMHIHLLIVDLHRPNRRNPQGIHAKIWREITNDKQLLPPGKPFTAASYESGLGVRAYVQHFALGDPLTDMPLFLAYESSVEVPLEATYNAAFDAMPRRWRDVIIAPQ